jgi:hypothetical protein
VQQRSPGTDDAFSPRDALATRLYTVRMMEQFMSNRQIASELAEFDEKTVTLYMVGDRLIR